MVELNSFAVDPHEDVRDLLFVDRRRDFKRGEWVLLKVEEPIKIMRDVLFLVIGERCLRLELVDEVVDELSARLS